MIELTQNNRDWSITRHFEEQVSQFPDRPAIETGRHQLTYEELNRAANRVAHDILAQRGAHSEPVAMLCSHGAGLLTALVAVLKSGKFYVSLDPSSPVLRNTEIVTHTEAPLILTDNANLPCAESLAGKEGRLINVDEIGIDDSAENLGLSVSPDSPFAIFYTSGSTGKPKGVVRGHRSLLHDQDAWSRSLQLRPEDRLSLLNGCHFAASTDTICGALLNGACLLPLDPRECNLGSLIGWLIQKEITILDTVPTLFRHIVETLTGRESFPKLRYIYLTGESVSRRDFENYRRLFLPTCKVLVGYGSSEALLIRLLQLDHDTRIDGERLPTGDPIEGKEVVLFGDNGEEVNPFCVGEMVVRSRYLCEGYWRQPELTAERFLADPKEEGVRLYRTGDMGRFRADGSLELLGRQDRMVKVAGIRVEPSEVEIALQNLEEVKEAAVVPQRQSQNDDVRLVAYVVSSRQTSIEVFRQRLREKLPDYMIPSRFVLMESLPLTSTGKIDQQALRDLPTGRRPELETSFVEAHDLLEHQISRIWERVLGLKGVGVQDNFFDLGGTSLEAVRLFSEIESVFENKLSQKGQSVGKFSMSTLFQAATIEKLANLLRQHEGVIDSSSLVALRTDGSGPNVFFLPGSAGNVFTDLKSLASHLGPDYPFYGLQEGLENPTNVQALAAQYVQEIRTVQPRGPYYLAGLCGGGMVAFEMAQHLQAQGEDIALLALVEPVPPQGPGVVSWVGFVREVLKRLASRLGHHSRSVARLDTTERKSYMRMRARVVANFWAVRQYVPRPFAGKIHLFLTTRSHKVENNPQLRWQKFALDGIDIHEIPGHHGSVVGSPRENNMKVLADQLRVCIVNISKERDAVKPVERGLGVK